MIRARGSTVLLFFFALAVLFFVVWLCCPKPLLINRPGFSTAVYDEDGRLLRLTLSSDEKYRLWLPLAQISPELAEATLLYEDRWFYLHPGINPYSLVRAAFFTYLTSHPRTGGSTITMQLARMRFGINSKTLSGKVVQIARALQLERHYSKQELLEAYLNLAPYGENVEGAGAASLIYFGCKAAELTLPQALALSVVPQNPVQRRPSRATSDDLYSARLKLLAVWHAEHAETADSGFKLPFEARQRRDLPFAAPHFVDGLLKQHRDEQLLISTLSTRLQLLLERSVQSYIEKRRSVGINNAAVLLVDYSTMGVKASVGSADFGNAAIKGQVDGTKAKRSPGSALKPFLYALAADQGLIHAKSVLKDTPASFASYNPENFDRDFIGPIDATNALIRSRNIPAIELANRLKNGGFYAFLRRSGISKLQDEHFYGLSLVLGGVEVTMEEMAQLYAMLANGGVFKRLQRLKGAPLETGTALISPEAAYMALEMLRGNPRPDDVFQSNGAQDLPWKTGTSFGFRDAWAAGVAGQYILAVWIGDFDGKGNPAFVGREAAGPLFFHIVDALKSQGLLQHERKPPPYLNLKRVKVCAVSGELPGPHCNALTDAWFIAGKSPIDTCSIHRQVLINPQSGLRACSGTAAGVRAEVYEFWPSDLLKLFRSAGMARRLPPKYEADCDSDPPPGLPPQITSPEKGISYVVRAGSLGTETIPFRVIADTDIEVVYWFVDDRLVSKLPPSEIFFWTAVPGNSVVRVVDERGRADERKLNVKLIE